MDRNEWLWTEARAEQTGRNFAHAYERLHLQHPRLSHNELLRQIVAERQEIISRVSPDVAQRIGHLQELLLAQSRTSLGELAFELGLMEANIAEASLGREAAILRLALDNEITKTLGYMPDSSEIAISKRRLRDVALQTEAGYRHYLKSTFGVDEPLDYPQFMLENAVLQTRQEWEKAAEQVWRLGLPAHFQSEKNWDSLTALDCILRRTDKTAMILDAGTELYSVILPCLFLYGYKNLIGINLVFDQPLGLGTIRYEYGDIANTTFRENTFDAITCLSVIEHGINLQDYFREASRILKVGGFLITSTDYYPSPIDTRNGIAYGVPIHIFTKEEIMAALDTARDFGLELTSPLSFESKDKTVRWEEFDLCYTFMVFTLEKKG